MRQEMPGKPATPVNMRDATGQRFDRTGAPVTIGEGSIDLALPRPRPRLGTAYVIALSLRGNALRSRRRRILDLLAPSALRGRPLLALLERVAPDRRAAHRPDHANEPAQSAPRLVFDLRNTLAGKTHDIADLAERSEPAPSKPMTMANDVFLLRCQKRQYRVDR